MLLTYTVSSTADSGVGSLRQTIIDANASANAGGPDVITFDIGADGSQQTINLLSALDPISEAVTIDGLSQYGVLSPSVPLIVLNGAGTSGADGLALVAGSDGSTIQGLIINNFDGDGIQVEFDDNVIAGNYIGTNAAGTANQGNGVYGININNASGNIIGGTTVLDRNVISGNDGSGIYLFGAGTTGTVVQGNYIGTNAAGTAAIANTWDGIVIRTNASNNTIGGTLATERNIISGNGEDGIFMDFDAFNNTVSGNYIGTDVTGTNALGNTRYGVTLYNGVNNTTIGGTAAGAGNVISGNINSSFVINGDGGSTTDNNVIQGNFIGTDKNGTTDIGNGGEGLDIFNGADSNLVGGTVAGARNIISGNNSHGIEVSGVTATGNAIVGNYIGTNAAGMAGVRNEGNGIRLSSIMSTTVGGTTAGAGNVISGNNNSGTSADGIYITGGGSHMVQGNYLGLAQDGSTVLGNYSSGIAINSSSNNLVGGTTAGVRNIISGNTIGVNISGSSNSNDVKG